MATAVAGRLSNLKIAQLLRETAALLEIQQANVFRVQAYRRAADAVAAAADPIPDLLDQGGPEAIDALPGIGAGLASAIADLVVTGRLAVLERLRGRSDPVSLLASLPGIGPVWADRVHHELGIGSLEDLELAAHDGRLEGMKGMGPKRLEGIRTALAGRLRRPRPLAESPDRQRPAVEDLLDVDREYRRKARAGELRTIAPLRFNPNREAWLPVLHTTRGAQHFTALYTNTARAHRLGRSKDWVVIYFDGRAGEGQCTVVTEFSGPLRGRRVVRGREGECLQHYDVRPPPDPLADTDGDGVI